MEILHWYDFLCPQSYIAQHRNAILRKRGITVTQLPYQTRRDVPAEGFRVGSRQGGMYTQIVQEAKEAGLKLYWSSYIPNTRGALACAEWVRRTQPEAFLQFQKSLFDAHFVMGQNIGDPAVVDRYVTASGIDVAAWHAALADSSAGRALWESEVRARESNVRSTPAWLIGEQLITSLLPAAEFEELGG